MYVLNNFSQNLKNRENANHNFEILPQQIPALNSTSQILAQQKRITAFVLTTSQQLFFGPKYYGKKIIVAFLVCSFSMYTI